MSDRLNKDVHKSFKGLLNTRTASVAIAGLKYSQLVNGGDDESIDPFWKPEEEAEKARPATKPNRKARRSHRA